MGTNHTEIGDAGARIATLSTEKRRLLELMLREQRAAPTGQARLTAFVTAQEGADSDELRRFMRERVPHYMVPATIEILPELPRTPNGKLDLEHLRRHAQTRPATQRAPAPAEPSGDAIVRKLRTIWAELLGVAQVADHDDFFALGGHSLLAVRMLARVQAELGYDLPVALIVESPTIARLAGHLRSLSSGPKPVQPRIAPIQPAGALPPLYFLPLHTHGALHYRHLKPWLGVDRPLYGFAGFDPLTPATPRPTIEELAGNYLEALLQFQPRGPYYLSGNSVAGLLAFEMARQFHARGRFDVVPILFDSWGPGYPERLALPEALGSRVAQLQALGNAGIDPHIYTRDLLIDRLQKLKAAVNAARSRVRPTAYAQNGPPQHAVDEALGATIAAYFAEPRPYQGLIVLFHASLQPWNGRHDPTLGWSRFAQGEIRVTHARGSHLGIFGRMQAGNLATLLVQQLAQLDQTYTSGQPHWSGST